MVEVPDLGNVRLEAGEEGVCLFHIVTRERARLPSLETPRAWRLAFSDEGGCDVQAGDDLIWGASLFHCRAVKADGMLVIVEGDDAEHYADDMGSSRLKLLPLFIASASVVSRLWFFVREQHGGARWWWVLNTIWQALQPSAGRPGEWVANWWRHWVKRFAKMWAGAPDFRPSRRMQRTDSFDVLQECAIDFCILPEPVVSTKVFLALVVRLATSHSVGKAKKKPRWSGGCSCCARSSSSAYSARARSSASWSLTPHNRRPAVSRTLAGGLLHRGRAGCAPRFCAAQ